MRNRTYYFPLHLTPDIEAHLREIRFNRDRRLEPESTLTNIVGHYEHNINTGDGLDEPLVDVDLSDHGGRPSSEIFRGATHDADGRHGAYGSADIDRDSPKVLRTHRLSGAPFGQPPSMRAPSLPPIFSRGHTVGLRLTNEFTDPPNSDRTYGNTGQLLGLETPLRTQGSNRLPALQRMPPKHDDGNVQSQIDDLLPPLVRHGPRQADPRAFVQGLPQSSSLNQRLMSGGNISPTPEAMLQRTPTFADAASARDSDWESEVTDFDDIIRQSMDSYANTSTTESQHRLSYPRQPMPKINPLFASRAHPSAGPSRALHTAGAMHTPQHTSAFQPPSHSGSPRVLDITDREPPTDAKMLSPVLPTWQATAEDGDETMAKRILEDKLMQNSILGSMGCKGKRQDKDAMRADAKQLEALRQRNPSALRAAVERTVEAVKEQLPSNLTSIFGIPSPTFAQSPLGGNDTERLLDRAATPARSMPNNNNSPMVWSDTVNSFATSPDGTLQDSPRSPDG